MMEDFFLSPLQPELSTFNLATGKALLCAVLICHNCGNAVLINLVALGIPQIHAELERRRAEKKASEKVTVPQD